MNKLAELKNDCIELAKKRYLAANPVQKQNENSENEALEFITIDGEYYIKYTDSNGEIHLVNIDSNKEALELYKNKFNLLIEKAISPKEFFSELIQIVPERNQSKKTNQETMPEQSNSFETTPLEDDNNETIDEPQEKKSIISREMSNELIRRWTLGEELTEEEMKIINNYNGLTDIEGTSPTLSPSSYGYSNATLLTYFLVLFFIVSFIVTMILIN